MSRAYRIRVSESLRRILRGGYDVSTHLEILPVLPAEELAALLAAELAAAASRPRATSSRVRHGVEIVIDPAAGQVTVQTAGEQEVTLHGDADGWSYDQEGEHAQQTRAALKDSLHHKLKRQAGEKQAELQAALTARLEAQLADLRQELDQVANQVTAAARTEGRPDGPDKADQRRPANGVDDDRVRGIVETSKKECKMKNAK